MSHTPGPWVLGEDSDESGMTYGVRAAGVDGKYFWLAEINRDDEDIDCADARLMSAAPELLEALEAFVHWYSENSTEFNRDMAYGKAIAAIAKARGDAIE